MGRARSGFQWYADGTRLVFALPGSVPGSTARIPWGLVFLGAALCLLGGWMAFGVGQDILTGTSQGGTGRASRVPQSILFLTALVLILSPAGILWQERRSIRRATPQYVVETDHLTVDTYEGRYRIPWADILGIEVDPGTKELFSSAVTLQLARSPGTYLEYAVSWSQEPGTSLRFSRQARILLDGVGTLRHYASHPEDRAEIGADVSAERANALVGQTV
ncbi:MAG: hypothetical protein QJR09_11410 [Micrococcus sp.]|nr:hypothetical protein [Micrococcus sp.]